MSDRDLYTGTSQIIRIPLPHSSTRGRLGFLIAFHGHHPTTLRDLAVAIAARHRAGRSIVIRGHGCHGERVGVVSVVEQHARAHLLDTKDTNGTGRVAMLDTWMTWHRLNIL